MENIDYLNTSKISKQTKHCRRIGYKKGHQISIEQREMLRKRMIENKIWNNPNSLKARFKKGIVPQYHWIDITDLLETNPLKAEKELYLRDYHSGKIKTNPNDIFRIFKRNTKIDNEYYDKCLIRTRFNKTYLKHLKIVQKYKIQRKKYRRKYNVNKTRIHTILFSRAFSEMHKQYRISLVCVNRYKRLFKKWGV